MHGMSLQEILPIEDPWSICLYTPNRSIIISFKTFINKLSTDGPHAPIDIIYYDFTIVILEGLRRLFTV